MSVRTPYSQVQAWVELTVAPITLSIQVSEVQARLLAKMDICCRPGDFPGDERTSPPGALVVEENTVARVHAIRLAVVDCDPERIQLCDTIGRARVERRGLALRRLHDLPVELGRGCLVEADMFLQAACTDGV